MAVFFENKDRRLIPNWRDFNTTIQLGELDSLKSGAQKIFDKSSIEKNIGDWVNNNTIAHAADLISSAVVLNLTLEPEVIKAADFILQNNKYSSDSLSQLASRITDKNSDQKCDLIEQVTLTKFNDFNNKEDIHLKIKRLKQITIKEPNNAINWVELARNYSILGHMDKQRKAMLVAVSLAPNNRFVIRSAVRLFIHINEVELAHSILRKCSLTQFDPWLLSAEIAISSIRERYSPFIKKAFSLIESKTHSLFNITELASSLATLELNEGNFKKSRSLFNLSLKQPNDNALAQIEWASSRDKSLIINPASFKVNNSFEALALKDFHEGRWNDSLINCEKWFLDLPFSKRPLLLGSFIANNMLEDFDLAIQLCEYGLTANPGDPMLINNLAYSCALSGKSKRALLEISKIKNSLMPMTDENKITLQATYGLILFRSGFSTEGRNYYHMAITNAKTKKNKYLTALACINLSREEIVANTDQIENSMLSMEKECKDMSEIQISYLKQKIESLYEKVKRKEDNAI